MKKRFLSIVLAVLMLVGIMPISAIAADAEPPAAQTGVSTKTSENTTGPKLEKSAQWVDEKAGIAEITIKVTGEQPTETTKKTDIVLVIDRSLSMTEDDNGRQRDWLKNAKQAAKAFAKKVLTGDPNVRIAVVAYAAKTINDWDFSSKLATVENNIDAINTNNVYYNGQWYANHNSLWSENWHGTNIQAGIHSARERLKKSVKDADKFMIVLADGAPNWRFRYKGGEFNKKTFALTNQAAETWHIDNQRFGELFYATDAGFKYNEDPKAPSDGSYVYTATVSEAYAAKATDGITCYAIGYGIPQGNNEINALMYSIASTDAGFVNAGTDENAITKVFSDIATDIQYKAHDVTLTDTMGAGFTYLANETYPSNPVVTPSADNKTVTWNVADKLGDETKTLTFYVQYDKQNLTEAETLPTNTSASLSYKDNKDNAQTPITVDSPAIENLAFTVTYLDETGEELTAAPYTKTRYWYGDTVTLAPAPTKEGYTFNGWTTDDVTIGENDTFEMPKQNVTLKATWTKNTKTLTITKNWEGTTEKPTVTFQLLQARKGEENTTVYQTFELDGIVDTEGEVVETAPWTATIKVPVKDTDGTEFKYSVKETKIGGTSIGAGAFNVTGTNPDNTSYIIGTWSVNSSGRPLDGTWTFTNKYAPKPQYTLTYEFVGEDKPEGANAPAAESLYKDQQTHLAEVNAPDGWSFDGWYTDAGCTEGNKVTSPYTMPGSNMTLYGKWEQKQPGVSVEKTAKRIRNGIEEDLPSGTGTVRVDDTIKYTVKATNTGNVELRNVSILECFGGRNKFEDDKTKQKVSGLFDRYGFTIAQTLAPGATATRTFTYVVTDADEDHGEIKNHLSMQEATYFDGQKDAKIPSKTAPSHEVKVEKPHGVKYEFEAGLPDKLQEYLPNEDPGRYYKGDSVDVLDPKQKSATIDNTNYTFAGWHVDGVKVTGSTYTMDDKDVTFVGKWNSVTEKQEFTVTYHVDGDAPVDPTLTIPGPHTVIEDEPYTVAQPLATNVKSKGEETGTWTFTGWCTDTACETEPVASIEKITGNVNLYGKWTFEADKPEITEAGYTVEYYRQDADGNYSNKPYYTRTTTDAGVPLKGNVGDTVKIEDLEPFYKEHYKGYEFDANNEKNVPQCTLQADASKNVLRLYYKALPELEVKKEVDKQYNVKHGDTLTYTITVKNAGARNLTNVEVTDVIDAADPSKLEILPGEGYTYNEASGKIEIGRMEHDNEVVIKATYVVQEADSGHTIKNTATGSADEVEGVKATVNAYPNKIEEFKGDLVISKTYRSDTSTSPAATFYFDVYYMDGDEQISLLDEYAEISFDKNEAKKGAPATKTVEVKLNDVNEKVLESGFYVREVLEDKVDKVVYDRNAVHGFLVPFPLISAYADTDREPITVDREAYVVSTQVYENAGAFWAAWVTDELDENYNVFSFTNTYKTVRNEPVKVGPQLNRDDHVAYIMGYPDGTVQPEGEITRAEACTIFFRLLTDSSRDYYFSKTNDYTDVNAGDWFNNAISTLSNAGIVTGYNDGTFRPNQPITRGEMAKIIANFANLSKGGKTFSDLSGHWSKTYVELAAGNGWIAGYPDGSFRPDQKITRAETVTMINRVLERVPAKELRLLSRSIMLTFPDNNPGDWYYIAIQEASNSHEYQRSVYETTGDEMWTKLIDNVDWTKLEK